MEGRRILHRNVCARAVVQMILWSYSDDGYGSHFGKYPWSFPAVAIRRKWDKGLEINPVDETSHTTQYQEVCLKYAENEYCAKHRCLDVIKPKSVPSNNLFSSAMVWKSAESSYNHNDLSSDDEEYLMPKNVAETTPRWSDRTARVLKAARLHLNSPPESPPNWAQTYPNLNDWHSDQMEVCLTFWFPNITDWWHQQAETHSMYANPPNGACSVFSIIPHNVGVEERFSLGWDVIGWRQSKTAGEDLRKNDVGRQFALANNGILSGDDPALDTMNTENDLEMKREVGNRKFHWMVEVYNH